MLAYIRSVFCAFYMKRRQIINQVARWISCFLVVCILAGVHTETVAPRSFEAVNFQKVNRSAVTTELPSAQRRAITNAQQRLGIYDRKQKVAPLNNNSISEYKVTQRVFYQRIDVYRPAPNWFLVTSKNGKIHSQQYA